VSSPENAYRRHALRSHCKIETEWDQGCDTHLIEQHAHCALDRAIDGSGLLRGAPVDRGITFRQISTNAKPRPNGLWRKRERSLVLGILPKGHCGNFLIWT
jgi:hypothetical protein